MLEAARKIQRFTAAYDQERFKQDERTVLRCFVTILSSE